MATRTRRGTGSKEVVLASASGMLAGLDAASRPAPVALAAKGKARGAGKRRRKEDPAKRTADALSAADGRRIGRALEQLKKKEIDPDILVSVDDQLASLLQTELARISSEKGLVAPVGRPAKGAPVHAFAAEVDRFTTADWRGWLSVGVEKLLHLKKKPFLPPRPRPEPLPNRGRIAVLGDWGTGLYGAPVCAESIRRDAKTNGKFDVALHLGDVYYSGSSEEVWSRFLPVWPDDAACVNRALNSNHEMYSGGEGYFGETLPAFDQKSSCVAMQNDHFLFVGLDTGYVEHDVSQAQADWLSALVFRAKSAGRRVVLFSHHQPYSLYETQGPKLTKKLSKLLNGRDILAWYWGHEHRCVIFDHHSKWDLLGRCIGHGGFPYPRDKFGKAKGAPVGGFTWYRVAPRASGVPGGLVLDGPNKYLPKRKDEFGPNGYATLAYDGSTLVEQVHAADGRVLHAFALAP